MKTHRYTVNGGKLLQETNGSQTLTYYHGGSGIVGFGFNDTDHFFRKNLQGDVTAIYRADGTLEAEYTYDAWGKVLSVVNHTADNIGDRNPIRYRGYYYDSETKLYYLQSRYYDPETGRFINADDTAYLGAGNHLASYNLFAYCGDNPVMGKDPTGHWDWGLFAKIAITVVVVALCLTGVGAVAAAAATAAGVSVTAAVTTAVASAGVAIVCSGIDGAICAEASGGEWYDGLMTGMIGGSVGSLVSTITNPVPGSDSALRFNTAGRFASSLTYDLVYDYFDNWEIEKENLGMTVMDVMIDTIYAPLYHYYSGPMRNNYLKAMVNGVVEGAIDIFQTVVMFG